jgi:magnesium chelatase family protein
VNAEIPGAELRRVYRPVPGALAPPEKAMDLRQISARGADRIIRLSWTLADLAGVDRPRLAEVSYALALWLGTGL